MKLCPKCGKQYADDANFCPVDASRLSASGEEPAPAAPSSDPLAALYELGATVGGGRTGVVHQAQDKATQRKVAVKLIAAEVSAPAGAAARIEREHRQLERVASPGIAKVLGSGKRGETLWIATEFVENAQTLERAIVDRGPVPVAAAADIVEAIGEGLIEAAQAGVVHRDLAPKNVLFAGDEIKLINFAAPLPISEKSPGVPEFIAPEVVEGKPADQRSNIYSLGAIFYFALTGRAPFTGDTATVHQAHLNGTPVPPSKLVNCSAEVDALVLRALERAPSKRFLTVRQFVDEALRVNKEGGASTAAAPQKRADLVQTLLGVRALSAQTIAGIASAQVAGIAPAEAAPVAAVAPAVVAPVAAVAPAVSAPVAPAVVAPVVAPVAAPAAPAAPTAVAAPGPVAAVPPVAATPAAAPAVAAPLVPLVAAAGPNAQGASAKKGGDESKGKFRETMWFKKGDLDVAAAEAAAQDRAKGKDVATEKADSLPMDERYKDDGSITRSDKEKYSLRTGGTMMMQAIPDPAKKAAQATSVTEDALIGEMKGGRAKWFIVAGVAIVGLIVAILALT